MLRRSHDTKEERLSILHEVEPGRTIGSICWQYHGTEKTFRHWKNIVQSGQEDELEHQAHHRNYSSTLKEQAVQTWFSGQDSQETICLTYGIRSTHQLRYWVLQYSEGKALKSIFGYRMVQLHVNRRLNTHCNVKRIYGLMKLMGLKSVTKIKKKRHRHSSAEHTVQNLLERSFTVCQRNQKWLSDVTEFKYDDGEKTLFSAILDLYNQTIVAWLLRQNNDNDLIFQTLKTA